jgi:hypothetical protein
MYTVLNLKASITTHFYSRLAHDDDDDAWGQHPCTAIVLCWVGVPADGVVERAILAAE